MRTVFDFWIVGPSAIGSVNGTPSSMTSVQELSMVHSSRLKVCIPAPPASMPSMISGVSCGVG